MSASSQQLATRDWPLASFTLLTSNFLFFFGLHTTYVKDYLLATLYSLQIAVVLAYEPIAFLILMTLIAELVIAALMYGAVQYFNTPYKSHALLMPLGTFVLFVMFYPYAVQAGIAFEEFPEHTVDVDVFMAPFLYYKEAILATSIGIIISTLPDLKILRSPGAYDSVKRDFIIRTFSVFAVCAVAAACMPLGQKHKALAMVIILSSRIALIFAARHRRYWVHYLGK